MTGAAGGIGRATALAGARVFGTDVDAAGLAETGRLLDDPPHRRGARPEIGEDDWDLQYAVNLKAVFFLNREAARLMRRPGSIVNFSSQGWWTGGYSGSLAYAATKAGVVVLTRGLARTLAPRGVRVNAIAPGAVDTAMMSEGLSDQARADFLAQVPLGRMVQPRRAGRCRRHRRDAERQRRAARLLAPVPALRWVSIPESRPLEYL